jgi:hypothetical protein
LNANQSLDYIAKEKNKLLSAIQPIRNENLNGWLQLSNRSIYQVRKHEGMDFTAKTESSILLLVMVLLLENNRASGLVIMWLLGMVMDTKETLRI